MITEATCQYCGHKFGGPGTDNYDFVESAWREHEEKCDCRPNEVGEGKEVSLEQSASLFYRLTGRKYQKAAYVGVITLQRSATFAGGVEALFSLRQATRAYGTIREAFVTRRNVDLRIVDENGQGFEATYAIISMNESLAGGKLYGDFIAKQTYGGMEPKRICLDNTEEIP